MVKYMFESDASSSASTRSSQQCLERLEADICELAGHLAAATCRFLLLVGEFDRQEGWAQWDMPSCAAWLSWKCGLSSGAAREHVRIARRLPDLPTIRAEFGAGRLSYSKVRALTRIATTDSEAELVEMALPMTANQLERFARAHRTVTAVDDEQAAIQRRVTWRLKDDGSLFLTAHLPPEAGAAVLAALRAAVQREPEDSAQGQEEAAQSREEEAAAQSRPPTPPVTATSTSLADALVEVAETYLAGKTRDAQNPDVYHVIVHVDSNVLTGDGLLLEGRCHMDDGPAVSPQTAQMLACDALVSWMRHDARGDVLDVGRRHRHPPPALRRALRDRDKGRCQFPGCNSRRIDAHHIVRWTRGGRTCLKNLICLCRFHHGMVHKFGYKIEILPDGGFGFFRPDGTPIPNAAPAMAVRGQISDTHDAEISDKTIIPAWYGERLNLDYAIAVLFANQHVRQVRAARVSAETPAA